MKIQDEPQTQSFETSALEEDQSRGFRLLLLYTDNISIFSSKGCIPLYANKNTFVTQIYCQTVIHISTVACEHYHIFLTICVEMVERSVKSSDELKLVR